MIWIEPHYKQAIWGGRQFATLFGRQDVPAGAIGESWELCELPQVHCQVRQGAKIGTLLGDLWRSGALGGSGSGAFPFLLKWIDAQAVLSVQVHPDEATCAKLGRGAPKTESWYVAARQPDGVLWMGHHAGLDKQTLLTAAKDGSLPNWLLRTEPNVGDMFLLKAGMIHAIGAGLLLLEVQQPSDTTYRLYDWNRVEQNGQPRQLHLEDGAESIAYGQAGLPQAERERIVGPCFRMTAVSQGGLVPVGPLRALVATLGPAIVTTERGEHHMSHGEVVLAEPGDGVVRVAHGQIVWLSEP